MVKTHQLIRLPNLLIFLNQIRTRSVVKELHLVIQKAALHLRAVLRLVTLQEEAPEATLLKINDKDNQGGAVLKQ